MLEWVKFRQIVLAVHKFHMLASVNSAHYYIKNLRFGQVLNYYKVNKHQALSDSYVETYLILKLKNNSVYPNQTFSVIRYFPQGRVGAVLRRTRSRFMP